ncbi:MAG: D-lactate dehydrogenase [Candidatus Binataceae bacterium]
MSRITPAEVTTNQTLLMQLRNLVGRRHVVTGNASSRFANGYRFGGGPIEAAVRPGSLVEMWRVLEACVAADRIIIVQAANTGLTGGSTPDGVYDRNVVVISTSRMGGVYPIRGGHQVVCLAGATLYHLERRLSALGREPHSVIGSSCIGASVVGGVCNNSGGALVRRGPAYTEYALFAQVDESGQLRLRNHLGIQLGDDPETILRNVEAGDFDDADVESGGRVASAAIAYAEIVRKIDEPAPARFNADPQRLYEASGSAGRVVVFAVRLDTFAKVERSAVFYIGTDAPDELTELRRRILSESTCLPVLGEYIHREAFDLADRYGKDTVIAIRALGTDRLPTFFQVKGWLDRLVKRQRILSASTSDRLLQTASALFPDHLPSHMRAFRDRYEHHLILKVADDSVDFTRALLGELFPSASGDVFECTTDEAQRAMLHRFAVAGAAVRYRALHPDVVEDIVALDVALPRNARNWFERLPGDIEDLLIGKLYYGHFFCHVFHQDYLARKGADLDALKRRLLELMDARGAEYPAEHNVGHFYVAKPALATHYRQLDPTNVLNPGLGKTSRLRNWQ